MPVVEAQTLFAADALQHAPAIAEEDESFAPSSQLLSRRRVDQDDDAARDPAWLSRHALVAVPLESDLAVSLRQKLRESLPHARLVSLERIQHRGLWRAYARRRDDVAFYNENDADEILLWHGTGARAPSAVLAHQEGLDPRFSSGGFYGQGIYLAERAAYPVGGRYAHRVAGHGGTRFQLLLVRVAAGAVQDFGAEVTAATKKMRFPGRATAGGREREGGRLYDCVQAGPHRPHISGAGGPGDTDASRICVVYQADQMYPAFVCTFDLSFASLPAAAPAAAADGNWGTISLGMSAPASPVSPGVPARRAAVPQPATPSQPASPPQSAGWPPLSALPPLPASWPPIQPTPHVVGAYAWYLTEQHERGRMVTEIARRLLARRPNASAEWMQRLPLMSRRLEESLFRSATSFEEYRDTSTLKKRMLAIGRAFLQQQQQTAGPAPASPPAPSLNIRLHKVPEGEDVFFKVKTTTKLQKVFDAYATARYPGRDLRFLLDGERLRGDQTPADVDMEDGDQIDVFEDPSPAPKRSRQV